MPKDMNLPIASKGFAVLILDVEWPAVPEMKLDAGVFCRVLVDGWYKGYLSAKTKEEAIEKFNNKQWACR